LVTEQCLYDHSLPQWSSGIPNSAGSGSVAALQY
jgi:hypothetical protein